MCGAMASPVVMNVRYFGTSKVKAAGKMMHFEAREDENGQLDLDMGGLQKAICSLCNLPVGADITMVYIDADGDVVTLDDDDDLQEAWRQQLKCFRIDVMMNVDHHDKPRPLDLAPSAAAGSNDLMSTLQVIIIILCVATLTGIHIADCCSMF